MSASNTIRWFVKPSFDEPKLKSPQPCPRGVHCDYRRWNPTTKQMESAPCSMVHPGEEGTGRRLFPMRQIKEKGPEASFRVQPPCVRLTGAAHGYYERCWRKMSWSAWCAEKGIPYEPVTPGAEWDPVTIHRINGAPKTPQKSRAPSGPPPLVRKRRVSGALSLETWEAGDCRHCHPLSGCDGDHSDELQDGIFIHKAVPTFSEIPDAAGRMWYDSKTPVGAVAQALLKCEKLETSWHHSLKKIVSRATPEELAVELSPADRGNIEGSPHHYAVHVTERAERERKATERKATDI